MDPYTSLKSGFSPTNLKLGFFPTHLLNRCFLLAEKHPEGICWSEQYGTVIIDINLCITIHIYYI